MQAAPPVRIPVKTDALGQGFALACASLSAACGLAWALSWAAPEAWLSRLAVVSAAAGAASVVWFLLRRRAAAAGLLTWDGVCWQWAPAAGGPRPGRVQVMIDIGPWLLLRFIPVGAPGPAVWVAISRGAAAGQWAAWRATLYAPRSADAAPAITGPA
jgi:hypothetical protein